MDNELTTKERSQRNRRARLHKETRKSSANFDPEQQRGRPHGSAIDAAATEL
jgi:hypothetical protein